MIKFIIARHIQDVYAKYIGKSIEKINCLTYDVFDDDGENLSLTKKYNLGIDSATKDGINNNDIIVFVHEDVEILDPFFQEKVELVFQNNSSIGLCGVIGSSKFTTNGMWWATENENLSGHIIQENEEKEYHLIKGKICYTENVVSVDGLILMMKGEVINNGFKFDDRFSFNFYDIDSCFTILKEGYDIAIADILVKHKSPGNGSLNDLWKTEKKLCIDKWIKHFIFDEYITKESFKKEGKSDAK